MAKIVHLGDTPTSAEEYGVVVARLTDRRVLGVGSLPVLLLARGLLPEQPTVE